MRRVRTWRSCTATGSIPSQSWTPALLTRSSLAGLGVSVACARFPSTHESPNRSRVARSSERAHLTLEHGGNHGRFLGTCHGYHRACISMFPWKGEHEGWSPWSGQEAVGDGQLQVNPRWRCRDGVELEEVLLLMSSIAAGRFYRSQNWQSPSSGIGKFRFGSVPRSWQFAWRI